VNNIEREFIEGAARAMFVQAWATREEETCIYCGMPADSSSVCPDRCGEAPPHATQTYRGDVMDIAPPTPDYARLEAARLLGKLEAANEPVMPTLIHILLAAYAADGHPLSDYEPAISCRERWYDENAREFGSVVAMEALGHGVSWFDDHERFPLTVPAIEFELETEE
jgi:hypothetical protein